MGFTHAIPRGHKEIMETKVLRDNVESRLRKLNLTKKSRRKQGVEGACHLFSSKQKPIKCAAGKAILPD